ncbi:MAG: hypothetical protein IV100_13220 [Myxococcales bacterium]|nr:hypothetical protein [Myxococcales bacterium]
MFSALSSRIVPILAMVAPLIGCGDIAVATGGGGAVGESCTKKADCNTGLGCVGNVCTESAAGTVDGAADGATDGSADGGTDATDVTPDPTDLCGVGSCLAEWAGDGTCARECNCEAASFDGGDCQNLCTSDGLRAVWDVPGFEFEPGKCWNSCSADPAITACTSTCLTGLGLDQPCGDCFAIYIDCVATACGAACLDTPAEATCDGCASANCWPAFYTCSGAIGTPQ